MNTTKLISIIVPTYNEQANIESFITQLLETLFTHKLPYEIIFIDDRSADGTYEILQDYKKGAQIQVFQKEGEQGKAFSLVEGFSKAKGDIIVMIDSDLQYPPSAIVEMVKKLEAVDIVIAERKEYKASPLRKLMSRSFRFLFGKVIFGLEADVQSGLKVFTKEVWDTIEFAPTSGWAFDLEFLHRAKQAGFSLGGHPISFADRTQGNSKVNRLRTSIELASHAVALRAKSLTPFHISSKDGKTMRGAGLRYKKNHYVTHTTIKHQDSALETFTNGQIAFFVGVIAVSVIGLLLQPLLTLQILIGVLSTIYFADVFFNLYLVLKSLHDSHEVRIDTPSIENISNVELPVYSILCPLYKEAHIIPHFLKAIAKLDYPKDKLDVMLLLEEDDVQTREAVMTMKLPPYVRVLIVPDSMPKTKPKACNYGLAFAKGEYLVIYDAEDMPDPYQLKKAYLAFQKVPKDVICLQAKLNYYNPHQNWLTRFFTAEYSLWFDITLTGLHALNTNIPLGGTSNHFRTSDLHSLEGWDPFNVTEDADLGIRLFKKGYKTAIIDSVTLEEANSNVKNWLRQRSRWIKGYMQTYLVHTREVLALAKDKKMHSLYFHLTIGGKIAFILINPILWLATIAYFALYAYVGPQIEALYPSYIFYMAAISLVFGNFLFIYYYMIGCMKRQQWSLIKYVYLIPVYWLMISIAGAIALYQLLFKPHYWEKTIHGLHLKDVDLKKEMEISVPKILVAQEEEKSGLHFPNTFRKHFLSSIKGKGKYSAGLFLIAATFIANVLNYAFNAYIGRTVSLADFALLSVFSGLAYVWFIPFNAFSATVSYKSGFLEGKHGDGGAYQFWKITRKKFMVYIIAATVGFLVISPLLQSFFHIDSLTPFIIFAPVIIFGFLSGIDKGYLSGKLLFASLAVALLAEPITKLASAMVLVELNLSSYIYAALPLGAFATFVPSWIAASKTSKKRATTVSEASRFPKKYFFSAFVAGLSTIAFLTLDILLVKHYLPADEAGKYALISLLGKMIFFLGTMAAPFIGPIVSRNEGANKKSDKEFTTVFFITAVLTGIGILAFGLFPQFVVPLLLGEKAYLILGYLPLFAAAMGAFTLSRVFIMYYQNKEIHTFGVATFLISILQVVLFMFFHDNIQTVIEVMTIIGLLNLSIAFVLHAFIDVVVPLENNVLDFLDLFSRNVVPADLANKKSLKILIFNWRDTRHVWAGGAEVYLQEIAKRWVKNGHHVTLFCGNDEKNPRREVIDGVQIVRRGGFFTVYIWAFLYYTLRFRGKYDIVIDSENGIPFFTPLYVRKPIITIMYHVHQEVFRDHLVFPFSHIAMFLEAKVMPFIYRHNKVITISNSTKEEIIKHGLQTRKDIDIVTPGIDIQKYFLSEKTPYPSLSYVGRLKPYKNIDVAIKAFATLLTNYPNAKFFIAGEGESGGELQQLVKKLGITGHVSFLGKVTEKEKIALLGKSWVAVQPSQIEGWGITVIEANAAGTPVIASLVNGLKDSVVDGKTGKLVKVKDVTQWVSAMDEIISNKKLREMMSQNGLSWAKIFSWEESSKKAEEYIYADLHAGVKEHTIQVNAIAMNRS